MLHLYTYNAGKGGCIRIEYGDETSVHNIVIDTGVTRFAPSFQIICKSMTSHDLLILTHVDDDHIGGILSLLRFGWKCPFKEVRMNRSGTLSSGNAYLSVRQNDEVYSRLVDQGVDVKPILAGEVIELYNAKITTIWPKEIIADNSRCDTPLAYQRDYGKSLNTLADEPIKTTDHSINNRNSIVFIFEYDGRRLLFTGDAWGTDIVEALKTVYASKQHFDLVKLPHHGAAGNLSEEYPNIIQSDSFLICTDGVMHPDKQTIAKLIKWYGCCTVYSPSNWWSSGFFTDTDDRSSIELVQKEGVAIRW